MNQPNDQTDGVRRCFVLLGAPGVGKGTQAELLSRRFGMCHLSTGDVLRAAMALPSADQTPAIREALNFMKRGDLVPDSTIINLVRERVRSLKCEAGFLFDGFPRTVTQAEALDDILRSEDLKLTAVLNYELPIDEIIERLSGRRVCPNCKAVYHVISRQPRQPGMCDRCGTPLIFREDDRPEAIRVRMHAYEKSTTPLIEFYRRRGLLLSISSAGSPEPTFERTMAALAK